MALSNEKMLHAFGDSFVLGDLDDFYHEYPWAETEYPEPTHGMHNYEERVEYLKKEVSFASIIAKNINFKYNNNALRGSGNYPQLDKLSLQLAEGIIKKDDIILFGITTTVRDRLSCAEIINDMSKGECMACRTIFNSPKLANILELDYYYILSILDTLSRNYNVAIIKFNLFNNPIPANRLHFYNNFDVIGKSYLGNTLIDILNDSWGSDKVYPYHTELIIPNEKKHLYTRRKHPSVEGHKKIAEWFLKNVNLLKEQQIEFNTSEQQTKEQSLIERLKELRKLDPFIYR